MIFPLGCNSTPQYIVKQLGQGAELQPRGKGAKSNEQKFVNTLLRNDTFRDACVQHV